MRIIFGTNFTEHASRALVRMGACGISKAVLGSVASKVMLQSRRPLLIVREAKV